MIGIKRKGWSIKEQTVFLRRLGELIQQGYTFEQASQFLLVQLPSKRYESVEKIIARCKQGESLYIAFGEAGFHKDILGYLFFAEQHGDISFALREGSNMLSKRLDHTDKLKKLLKYPLFLLFFVGVMFTMIEKVLLPQFTSLFSSMNYQENILSKLLLQLPLFSRYLLLIVAFFLLIVLAYYFYFMKKQTAKQNMKLHLKIPLINQFMKLYNSQFFSVQLSNLLKGGLSIFQALTMFEHQNHSAFFREEAKDMKASLLAGNRLDEIIKTREFYESDLPIIILHGQTSGNLASELQHYSQFVIERLEEKISKLLTILQPILFTIIGVIILLMYAAIMVPMFQLLNGI
ncbi:competence type IV pilus assembly protein ComGB [Fredinandcohnia humi]